MSPHISYTDDVKLNCLNEFLKESTVALSPIEQGQLLRLFNRGGCILNFTRSGFDAFSLESVGVGVCSHYDLPMAKSLNAFINEASEEDKTKLLCDLFDYYDSHCSDELEGIYASDERRELYEKCLPVVRREKGDIASLRQRQDLQSHFTSDYMYQQISLLFSSRETNPTEAIGKSKELIECCCKTVLEKHGCRYAKQMNVQGLVKATMKCLNIDGTDINADLPAGETVKRILGSLGSVAAGIAELRNPYGSGHGKADSYVGLTARHAKLAVGSAATLVEYLWEAHEWRMSNQLS